MYVLDMAYFISMKQDPIDNGKIYQFKYSEYILFYKIRKFLSVLTYLSFNM